MHVPFNAATMAGWRLKKDLKSEKLGANVTCFDFEKKGPRAIAASAVSTLQLYHASHGLHLASLDTLDHTPKIARFILGSESCVYSTTNNDTTLFLRDLQQNTITNSYPGDADLVTGIEVCPESSLFWTCSQTGSVRCFDHRSSTCQGLMNASQGARVAVDSPGLVLSVAYPADKKVSLYDIRFFERRPFLEIPCDVLNPAKLEFSNNGRFLAVSGSQSHIFNATTGAHITAIECEPLSNESISPTAFSPDGEYFFVGSGDKTLHVHHLVSEQPEKPIGVISTQTVPRIVAFSSVAMLMVTANESVSLYMTQISSKERLLW